MHHVFLKNWAFSYFRVFLNYFLIFPFSRFLKNRLLSRFRKKKTFLEKIEKEVYFLKKKKKEKIEKKKGSLNYKKIQKLYLIQIRR